MKKIVLIFLSFLLLFAVGCNNASEKDDVVETENEQVVVQKDSSNRPDVKPGEGNGRANISIESIDTKNFSQEQMDMLEKYENEEITAYDLLSSGLFTREELGASERQGMLPAKEELNLEGLSEETLDLIDKLYNEEITFEELMNNLSAKDIENIGLRGAKMGANQN